MSVTPDPSRFTGCLLGGAIGDALGYPVEFLEPGSAVRARFGSAPPAGLGFAGTPPGLVSDDTQMTLFTAEGLLRARRARAGDVTPFVFRAYQRWYTTQAMRPGESAQAVRGHGLLLAEVRLYARRAPGTTCLGALAQTFKGRAMGTLASPPNYSKGCGGVMRVAPFGLALETRRAAFGAARDAALLTHGHPSGYLSAGYLACLVHDLARGASLEQAMPLADRLLAAEAEHEEVAARIAQARELAARGAPDIAALERLGGGWTGEEALAIALVCALTASGPRPDDVAVALWRSVAHGGDSDSTGSITGQLLGAAHGDDCLPPHWRQQLEMRELIERVARDLWTAYVAHGEVDGDAYPAS